jgi:hypothetical protein
MGYRKLAEGARNLIISYLQTNLPSCLNTVAASSPGNPAVSLENPRKYFIYAEPKADIVPAVFVMCDNIDFRITDKKPNALNAKDKFRISILVEDQDQDRLTIKCDRYLSGLHSCLDKTVIPDPDGTLNLIVVVYRATFSPVFMRQDTKGPGGQFRKECVLECDVEHIEKN